MARDIDLTAHGARVRSVHGGRVLIDMPRDEATAMFPDGDLGAAATAEATEATEADLAVIRSREPAVANSALAATALQLAHEMDNPYNSATSKSMCARVLLDALDRLRELAPPAEEDTRLDDLTARRLKRLDGRPAAASS